MRADADTDVDAVPGSDADSVNRALDAFPRAIRSVSTTSRTDREGETDIIYRLAPSTTRRRSRTCETTRVG